MPRNVYFYILFLPVIITLASLLLAKTKMYSSSSIHQHLRGKPRWVLWLLSALGWILMALSLPILFR